MVAFFYYAGIAAKMWFSEPAEGAVDADVAPTPFALQAAMFLATAIVIVIGIYPQFFARLGELAFTPGDARPTHGVLESVDPGIRGPALQNGVGGGAMTVMDAIGRGSGATGRSRSPSSRTSRSTTRTGGSSRAGTAPGARGATSSPVPRSVRCSAPWWPAPSMPRGPSSLVRIRSSSSRRARHADASRPTCCAPLPECALALRYVLVERSPALRAHQRELLTLEPADEALGPVMRGDDPDDPDEVVEGMGPIATSLDDLPGVAFTGVVLANELLDNLPVRIVERRADGWSEVRIGLGDGGALVETVVAADPELTAEADEVAGSTTVPPGARLPVPEVAAEWLARVAFVLRRGKIVLVDYVARVEELLARGPDGWLRTYREHGRGTEPLDVPGAEDITCDVPLEYLATVARAGLEIERDTTQAEWLGELGVDELVAEGRAIWRAPEHMAISRRSRRAAASGRPQR